MNNENNNLNGKKKPFEVHISDEDYFNSDTPVNAPQTPAFGSRKKFEVHIDDDALPPVQDDHTPQYKGEVYFSNRKPLRKSPQPAQNNTENNSQPEPESPKKNIFTSASALFWIIVFVFTTAFSAVLITCINDVLALNRSEEVVKVTIPQDATTNSIIDILSDEGLVKQKIFCKVYYKAIDFV